MRYARADQAISFCTCNQVRTVKNLFVQAENINLCFSTRIMTEITNPSDAIEDELLDEDDEEQVPALEKEVHDVKSVMTNLSKSLQIMAESMQAMEVSLKRLHSPASESETPAKKRREEVEVVSDGEDDELSQSIEPAKADSAEGDHSARLEQDNSNDSLLLDIEQDFSEQEDTGPPISPKLADIINKRWSEKLSEHKLHEKREKYHRPTNCDRVIVPRVNPEIWARIDHGAKQLDLRATAIQTNLVKVGAILAQSTDKLLSLAQTDVSRPEIKALITLNTDAMALLGHASCDLSQRRRETLKPHLNKEYATLCASHVPITSFLFGDDLQAQLTSIRATNKVSNTIGEDRRASRRPQQPSSQGWQQRHNSSGRGHFLSKGFQRRKPPPKKNQAQWKPQRKNQ